MKKEKRKKSFISFNLVLVVFGLLMMINIAMAYISPGYASSISNSVDSVISTLTHGRTILIDGPNAALTQGGVKGINIKKVGEDTKKKVEGATGEGEKEAAPKATKATPAKPEAKKKKKTPPKIDPKTLELAFSYFNMSLLNRDVIQIGQSDKLVLGENSIERPYVSKSFRDNPFDEVQEIDINPQLSLKKLPEPPFYPPPGSSTISITGEEFKSYVETLKLNGVIAVNDKFYAIIRSGGKTHIRDAGSNYKEKFTVNVDDVTLDTVIVSDEFGNKGILDFDYRRGYQVQPMKDAIYITNMGV
jgi:hypothetical protein